MQPCTILLGSQTNDRTDANTCDSESLDWLDDDGGARFSPDRPVDLDKSPVSSRAWDCGIQR